MQITIRLAQPEDIPQLNEMIALSVRGLSIGYYTSSQIESAIKYIFGVDTQLIADGTYFVAEVDGTIVACGGWSKRRTLFGADHCAGREDAVPNHDLSWQYTSRDGRASIEGGGVSGIWRVGRTVEKFWLRGSIPQRV